MLEIIKNKLIFPLICVLLLIMVSVIYQYNKKSENHKSHSMVSIFINHEPKLFFYDLKLEDINILYGDQKIQKSYAKYADNFIERSITLEKNYLIKVNDNTIVVLDGNLFINNRLISSKEKVFIYKKDFQIKEGMLHPYFEVQPIESSNNSTPQLDEENAQKLFAKMAEENKQNREKKVLKESNNK